MAFLRAEVVRSCPPPADTEALRADLLALADPEEIDFYLEEANIWRAEGRSVPVANLLEALRGAAQITPEQRTLVETLLALPEVISPASEVTPGEAPPDAS